METVTGHTKSVDGSIVYYLSGGGCAQLITPKSYGPVDGTRGAAAFGLRPTSSRLNGEPVSGPQAGRLAAAKNACSSFGG